MTAGDISGFRRVLGRSDDLEILDAGLLDVSHALRGQVWTIEIVADDCPEGVHGFPEAQDQEDVATSLRMCPDVRPSKPRDGNRRGEQVAQVGSERRTLIRFRATTDHPQEQSVPSDLLRPV